MKEMAVIKFETKTVKIGQEKKGAVLLLISLSNEKNPKAKDDLQKLSKALRHRNISLQNKEKVAEQVSHI